MLRNIALCAACLAARGLAPGSSFAVPTQVIARRSHSRCRKIASVGVVLQTPSASQQQQQRQRQSSVSIFPTKHPLRCRGGDEQEVDSVVPEDPPSPGDLTSVPMVEAWAAPKVDSAQDPGIEALTTSKKTFVTGAILACSMFVSSTLNLETTAPAHAVTQQQQQRLEVVASQPPRKVRPPPPEIPAGRITIVQWCDRNIGRYLPKVDVQAAAETAEKIRINSGPAPTVEDLRSMVGDAAKREWGGLLGEAFAGHGKTMGEPSGGRASPEAEPEVQSPESVRREKIDALKAEMLERQLAPPEATQAPSERQSVPYSGPPLPRVSSILPPSVGVGASSPTGADAIAQRVGRDRPAVSRKDKKRSPRTVQSAAIDLKAELRTESEKAAASSSPSPQPLKRNVDATPTTPGAKIAPSEGVALEKSPAAASVYSAPEAAQSLASATKATVVGASTESGGTSAGSPGGGARLEDVAAGARAALQELDLSRVSNKMQEVAGQVQDAAVSGGDGSKAGATAAIEQGLAGVERLQAGASRASSSLGDAATSLTDKLLPSGVPDPAEVSRAASRGLSEGSGRVAAQLSGSARKAATQMGGVKDKAAGLVGSGATVAGKVWVGLGRGAGGALSSVGGAGRVVSDGASALSKSAADGLPVLQDQASSLSSQVADASSRAASRATATLSAGSGHISRRLSDLAGGTPDAKDALGQLSTLGRSLADAARTVLQTAAASLRSILGISSDDERGDGLVYAVAAVLTGGVAVAVRGIGGGVGAGTGARVGTGAAGGGSAGKGRAGGEVERLLQPIGGAKETVAATEGERYGAEAISATGTLWDMIRDSGTGAGDAVREVSEEDLLARAAEIGGQLRETSEGLEVLKGEVLALRESIRESDLEGKARVLREALASTLEGPVAE